jgi:hypothetical protein
MREPSMYSDSRRKEMLKKQRLTSIWPSEELNFDFAGVDGTRINDEKLQNKIKELFMNVVTIDDLVEVTKGSLDFEKTMDWLQTALDKDMLRVARATDPDPAPAQRFNKIVVDENPFGSRYSFIASPTFGSGLSCPHMLALAMKVFMEKGNLDMPQFMTEMEASVRQSGNWVGGINVEKDDYVRLNAEFAGFGYRFIHRILPNIQKMKCC